MIAITESITRGPRGDVMDFHFARDLEQRNWGVSRKKNPKENNDFWREKREMEDKFNWEEGLCVCVCKCARTLFSFQIVLLSLRSSPHCPNPWNPSARSFRLSAGWSRPICHHLSCLHPDPWGGAPASN